MVECERDPVVVKAVMDAYAVVETVEYLQVAFSLVDTESVVCVVPAARFALGAVMVTDGGVTSAADCVVTFTLLDAAERLAAASVAFTVYVY